MAQRRGTIGGLYRLSAVWTPDPPEARLLALRLYQPTFFSEAPIVDVRYASRSTTTNGAGLVLDAHFALDVYYLGAGGTMVLGGTVEDPWPDPQVGLNYHTFRYQDCPAHRVALAFQTSTELAFPAIAADGQFTLYIDDVPVLTQTGLSFRGTPFGTAEPPWQLHAAFGSILTLDRVWVRSGLQGPSTNADGSFTSAPDDLVLSDDFPGGDLSAWIAWDAYPTLLPVALPYARPDLGGAGGYGLCWQANGALASPLEGAGPLRVHPGITQVVDLGGPVIPPPVVLPPSCPVSLTPTPVAGGSACATRLLP